MDWNYWIEVLGYPGVFIGTALEGETVLMLAAWFAGKGVLEIWWVVASATLGAFTGDQFFFFLGARKGKEFVRSREKWRQKAELVSGHLHRHRHWLMAGFRLVPGTRIFVPVALGSSGVKQREFAVYDFVGCLVWATGVSFFGLLFAEMVKAMRTKYTDAEWLAYGLVFMVTLGTVVFNLVDYRRRRLSEGLIAVRKIHRNRTKPEIGSPMENRLNDS